MIPNIAGIRLSSLEKRDYSWFFIFEDAVSIATEIPWCFINDDRIVVTSEDDGQMFGLPSRVDASISVLSAVKSKVIKSARWDIATGDLFVYFSNKAFFQFLQMSGGYEAWRLSVANRQFICLGGGEICALQNGNG